MKKAGKKKGRDKNHREETGIERKEKDEEKQRYSWEEEPQEKKFYFDRDLFQTPKAEKQQRNDDYWYSNRS